VLLFLFDNFAFYKVRYPGEEAACVKVMGNQYWTFFWTIQVVVGLSGCEFGRLPGRPAEALEIRTPGSWQAVSSGREGRISSGWLNDFREPSMSRAVDEALEQNRNLKVAAARFREAREATLTTRARTLPSASLGGGGSVTDGPSRGSSESYSLNLSSSWEVDLWGRLRDQTGAAEASELAAAEDFRGARLSLAANTAKAWCGLISAEQELALAETTLKSFEANLRIVERTYRGTGEGALDIQFSRTNVSSAARSVEQAKLNVQQAARTLELLLGRYPAGEMRISGELPKMPGSVPAGLPADLLDRRPDLVAARYRLFASAKRADAARKALLPSVSLTGSGGAASPRLSELLDTGRLAATLAGRFSQVLTEGGAVAAEARAALDRNDAQLNTYAQVALDAFREVEAALAADRSLAEQEKFLASELRQATLAERQAERDYSEGVNPNILSVLEAQRRANNARASMIRLQNQRLQTRIDLYLALGGDFRTQPEGA
jgi:NodT family efflux transporter outer membrane factor (OMF) lipoprotein